MAPHRGADCVGGRRVVECGDLHDRRGCVAVTHDRCGDDVAAALDHPGVQAIAAIGLARERSVGALPWLAGRTVGGDPVVGGHELNLACTGRRIRGRRRRKGPHDQVPDVIKPELFVERDRGPVCRDHLEPHHAASALGGGVDAGPQDPLAEAPAAARGCGAHAAHPRLVGATRDQRKGDRRVLVRVGEDLGAPEVDGVDVEVLRERRLGHLHRHDVLREPGVGDVQ